MKYFTCRIQKVNVSSVRCILYNELTRSEFERFLQDHNSLKSTAFYPHGNIKGTNATIKLSKVMYESVLEHATKRCIIGIEKGELARIMEYYNYDTS